MCVCVVIECSSHPLNSQHGSRPLAHTHAYSRRPLTLPHILPPPQELNYAPEIASGMLKKQQAGALIEARKLIVEGAVMIAQDAVRMLEADATVTMNNEDKVKLMTNLLTVTCSDTDATPTLSV